MLFAGFIIWHGTRGGTSAEKRRRRRAYFHARLSAPAADVRHSRLDGNKQSRIGGEGTKFTGLR